LLENADFSGQNQTHSSGGFLIHMLGAETFMSLYYKVSDTANLYCVVLHSST